MLTPRLPGALALLSFASLVFGLADCGGRNDDSSRRSVAGAAGASFAGMSGDGLGGAAGAQTCRPPSADNFEPSWAPPIIPQPGACTDGQVVALKQACEWSPTFDLDTCRAFETDPANANCLGCMFGAVGSNGAGAILVLPGGQWIANRSGCIALMEGDASDTSCGAKTQASDLCQYTACIAACDNGVSSTQFQGCETTARNGVCHTYVNAASCAQLPRYASCLYEKFDDYFAAMADLFCISGRHLPPEMTVDGGT